MAETAAAPVSTPAATPGPAASAPATSPAKVEGSKAGKEGAAPVEVTPSPVEAAPDKERFNPRTREFAALTRKEREVRQKAASLAEKEAKIAQWEQSQKSAREDPDAYLRQAGLTYDDVTKYYLNGKPPPEQQYRQLDERLKAQEQATQQRIDTAIKQERETMAQQRAITEFVAKIDKVVQSNPDYELTRHYEATDQVYQLIDLHYAKYNELLDIDVAARQIESALEIQKEDEAKKLLSVEKIKRKVAPTPPPDSKESSKQKPHSPPAPGQTITNAMTASTPAPASKTETAEQRWARIKARAEALGS